MSLVSYKSTFGCLKALKTEIEHLQLLLERAKVKLQRDFQEWWSQEAPSLQVTRPHPVLVVHLTTLHKAVASMTECLTSMSGAMFIA